MTTNPEMNITSYGGDPYGIKDSTNAFQSALNEAMTRGIPNATLDGAIKDVHSLQTRINVLGNKLEKGAESLDEEK